MMKEDLNIRIEEATSGDWKELQQLGIQTFTESFGDQNTRVNMDSYLAHNFNDTAVKNQLNNRESAFYMTWLDKGLIGYLKINTAVAQTEKVLKDALEIERIYVQARYQRMNIGKLLLDHAIGIAQEKNFKHIWLGVWDQNERAISFYERNGFAKFGSHPFYLGDEKQTDILMKMELL